jgi:DNA polymerase III sliding clamp (beta) subunit (PCNA family)
VTVERDHLIIQANNAAGESASEEIQLTNEVDCDSVSLGLNVQYMIETLKTLTSEEVILGLTSGSKPVTITGKDKPDQSTKAVIMPMRV